MKMKARKIDREQRGLAFPPLPHHNFSSKTRALSASIFVCGDV